MLGTNLNSTSPSAGSAGLSPIQGQVDASFFIRSESKTMMTYKGYNGSVQYDDEAEILHGEVLGLRDVITFQGTTVEELKRAFQDSVDDYLEFCEE